MLKLTDVPGVRPALADAFHSGTPLSEECIGRLYVFSLGVFLAQDGCKDPRADGFGLVGISAPSLCSFCSDAWLRGPLPPARSFFISCKLRPTTVSGKPPKRSGKAVLNFNFHFREHFQNAQNSQR